MTDKNEPTLQEAWQELKETVAGVWNPIWNEIFKPSLARSVKKINDAIEGNVRVEVSEDDTDNVD